MKIVSSIKYPAYIIMPRERTLLERFNNARLNEPLTAELNKEALAESVLQHLRKILNTRRGGSLIHSEDYGNDDYGMINLTEVIHNFPDSIEDLRKAIQTTITKYEPRLQNVQVEHDKSGGNLLTLKFKITAQIAAERRASMLFETVVEPSSGQVELYE